MNLSIVIVNWNTRDLLCNCLESIEENSSGLSVETIIIDNNSTDGSRETVTRRFPAVGLVNAGGNVGFARGCNLGVAHATADFLLFLNPDTEIRNGALQKMVEFMRGNASVGALGCKIRDVDGRTKPLGLQCFPSPWTELKKSVMGSPRMYRRWPRFFRYHDAGTSGYVEKLFGACLMVRKEVLGKGGTFDERFFMYCEDVDLCYRVARAGWKLYYISEAEIFHLGGGASAKAPGAFAVLMGCESFSKFMYKHHGRLGWGLYRAVAFLGALYRLFVIPAVTLASKVGLCSPVNDAKGSIAKYLRILGWTFGALKPIIKDQYSPVVQDKATGGPVKSALGASTQREKCGTECVEAPGRGAE